jgi:hypothetical protein
MSELISRLNELGERSGRALNELISRKPLSIFFFLFELVGYVSLTNRACFYSNKRISIASSSS